MLVVAERLAFVGLVLLAEVTAAALVAVQRVEHMSSPNSRKSATRPAFSSDWLRDLVLAEHADVLPELLADGGDLATAPS